jgi:hypothetical protein
VWQLCIEYIRAGGLLLQAGFRITHLKIVEQPIAGDAVIRDGNTRSAAASVKFMVIYASPTI